MPAPTPFIAPSTTSAGTRDFAPALTAKPGETIQFECLDPSGGQLGATPRSPTLANLDFGKINPVTGPVYVEGATPGDALKVTIRKLPAVGRAAGRPNIPGFGLLADQFKDPALHVWTYDTASRWRRAPLRPGGTRAAEALHRHDRRRARPSRACTPSCRRAASAATWTSATSPPGVTLYLPVEVEGALFSVGDTHAAQGDGEVCGTAIESQMNVELTIELVKGASLQDAALHHARAGHPPSRRHGL